MKIEADTKLDPSYIRKNRIDLILELKEEKTD